MKGYRLDGYTPMTQEEIDAWDDLEAIRKKGREQYHKNEDHNEVQKH